MAVTLECTYSSTSVDNLTAAPRSFTNCSSHNEMNIKPLPNDRFNSRNIEKWFYTLFYPLVLAFGTVFTLLTLWVVFTLKRQRLYENLTYTLVFMSFADLFALLIGASRNWAQSAFAYNLRVDLDNFGIACKLHVFLLVVMRDFAVLLKVVLCVSQLIAVFPSLNRERAFRDPIRTLNVLIASTGALCVVRSLLAAFSHEIVQIRSKSGAQIVECAVYEKPFLEKLNGYSTSGFLIVTYPLIILCNIVFLFKLRAVETMHKSLISSRKPEISLQTLDHVVSANEEIATRITLMDTSLDKCNNNNGSSNTPSHAKVEAPKPPAAVPAIRGGRRESLHLRSILLSVVITNFLFIALFLPFYVFSLLLVAQGDRPSKLVMDLQRHAGALLFLYHAINPLAYVLSYRSLKRHFLEVLCCRSSKFNDASQVVMRQARR